MAEFIFPEDDHPYYADEVGLALAGLVQREPDGSPRTGMLGAPTVSAVPSAWKVEVAAFAHVHDVSRSVRFTGRSTASQVDIVSAAGIPGGQARIDLIVWDPDEQDLVVIQGTASASPTPPADGGLVQVATVRVNAGDAMVIQGRIVPVYATTSLVGGDAALHGKVAKRAIPSTGNASVPITFPPGSFSEPPIVQVSLWGNARDCNATYDNVTANGFTLILGSNSPVDRVGGASWSAYPS